MAVTAVVAASRLEEPAAREEILALGAGVELLGEYEDSGFREPPLLARRGDGQMVRLTPLLYEIARASDGRRDAAAVADIVSGRVGKDVSADNVRVLAEQQLRPLGVLALADGTTPELPKRLGLLALRHRRRLLSEKWVNRLAAPLTWLHAGPVQAAALLALAGFDAWLFFLHGIAPGFRAVLYEPPLLFAVLVSVVVATLFHEFGHASACRRGGARPGVIGAGLYLVWPAFYCDVTEAYRLDRAGRLRTDLGGVYFNGIFALGCGAGYYFTGQEAFLFAAFVQHVLLFQQLLPLLRFDGYYVLSDLTGVPDILARIKPIFRSLVRGRRREPQVNELKPWVRVVVTLYLVALVPVLALFFALIVMSAPRMFATAYDSLGLQLRRVREASGFSELGLAGFRIAALVLPLAAMTLSAGRSSRLAVRGLRTWSRGSAPRIMVAAGVVIAVAGAVGYTWWPNGDYERIHPGEKGTVGEAIAQIPDAPGGRPSFTPEAEQEIGVLPASGEGAPAELERDMEADPQADGEPDAPDGDDGTAAPPSDDQDAIDRGDPGVLDLPPDTAPSPDATMTPDPTTDGTAPAPAPTSTSTPTATVTPESTATATPAPAETATPESRATATPAPTETAPATSDLDASSDAATPTPTPTTTASPVPTP